MRPIRDRMPMILRREDEEKWLDCATAPFDKAESAPTISVRFDGRAHYLDAGQSYALQLTRLWRISRGSKIAFLKDLPMARASIDQQYRGYRLSGDADPVSNHAPNWYATGRVWVERSDNSCIMADCFNDKLLA